MDEKEYQLLEIVPYEQARAKITTGDILLCSGNHPLSQVICKFSKSLFSHVAFVFTWNERVLVLESVEDDGVRAVPLRQYVYDYENSDRPYEGELYIARCDTALDAEKVKCMLARAADLLNRRYDQREIAMITLRIISGIGRHQPNDAYICSEFVDECFTRIGITFQRDTNGFIYPAHIATDPHVKGQFRLAQG